MPASHVHVDYDGLKNVAQLFSQEAEEVKNTIGKLNSVIEELHTKEWIGDGEKKFYQEMTNSVMPSMGRLQKALVKGSETSNKIADKFGETEDEVSAFWKKLLGQIASVVQGS